MSDRIDLDALERLAEMATPGPWMAEENGATSTLSNVIAPNKAYGLLGVLAPAVTHEDAAYLAACDPVTVAALVRAARVAVVLGRYARYGDVRAALEEAGLDAEAALAPFAHETGEAA